MLGALAVSATERADEASTLALIQETFNLNNLSSCQAVIVVVVPSVLLCLQIPYSWGDSDIIDGIDILLGADVCYSSEGTERSSHERI